MLFDALSVFIKRWTAAPVPLVVALGNNNESSGTDFDDDDDEDDGRAPRRAPTDTGDDERGKKYEEKK